MIIVLGGVAVVVLGGLSGNVLAMPLSFVLLAVLGAGFLAVFEINQSLMRSRGQTVAFVVWTSVALVSSQLLGFAAVLLGGGALGFVLGWVAGTGVGALGSLLVVRPRRHGVQPQERSLRLLRDSFAVAVPTVVYSAVFTALVYIDRFVLSYYHGSASAGRYQLAYTVGGVTIAALGAINLAWGPEVLRSLRAGPHFLTQTTADISAVVLVLVGGGVWLAPLGAALLAPAAYDREGITAAACLIMPLGTLQVLHYSRTNLLTWAGRLKALIPISVAAALLQLIGNIIVDDQYPLLGPPAVTTASFAFLAVALAWRVRTVGLQAGVPLQSWIAAAFGLVLGVLGAWATYSGMPLLERSLFLGMGIVLATGLFVSRRRARPVAP
jgi:O-antigen/teichoic acid export membrane protein